MKNNCTDKCPCKTMCPSLAISYFLEEMGMSHEHFAHRINIPVSEVPAIASMVSENLKIPDHIVKNLHEYVMSGDAILDEELFSR